MEEKELVGIESELKFGSGLWMEVLSKIENKRNEKPNNGGMSCKDNVRK